jgi:hypothetical protein
MFRNLFALFSTLMLGAGAASAANNDTRALSLQQRIAAAQKTINESMTAAGEPASSSSFRKEEATTWKNGALAKWRNWGNWIKWGDYRR